MVEYSRSFRYALSSLHLVDKKLKMDLLKAEMARKRKANDDLRAKLQTENGGENYTSPRYMKVSDRAKIEAAELERRQAELESQRQTALNNVNAISATKAAKKVSSLSTADTSSAKSNTEEDLAKRYAHILNLSAKESKHRLRMLAQAITLFGESNTERCLRLMHHLQNLDLVGDFEDETRHRTSKQQNVDEDDEKALEAEDLADARRAAKSSSSSSLSSSSAAASAAHVGFKRGKNAGNGDVNENNGGESNDEDDDDDENDIDKRHSTDSRRGPKLYFDASIQFSKIPNITDEKLVYKFFRALSKQWESDLNERDSKVKLTAKGKAETQMQKQCKDYIRPLFKMCKKKEVPYDVLYKLAAIVRHCEEGNFRAANDEYIKGAIGNSAWPIGK